MKKAHYLIVGIFTIFNIEVRATSNRDILDETNAEWSKKKKNDQLLWQNYHQIISKKWSDYKVSTAKIYVAYYNNHNSRIVIDFERGKVNFDTLSVSPLQEKSISKIFLEGVEKTKALIADQINMKDVAKDIVKALKENEVIKSADNVIHNSYSSSINLVSDHVKIRAQKYLPIIKKELHGHSHSIELILAMIWQESAFNPEAKSHIPALGLMQIVPKYAGNEVREFLGEKVIVDESFLFNPQNNIRYGINYLTLLSTRYFSQIEDYKKRVLLMISGFNWGPDRLLKQIEKGKINVSNLSTIKDDIDKIAPLETRDYLNNVLKKWEQIKEEKWV